MVNKSNVIIAFSLAIVWIILVESLSLFAILTGVAIGIVCVFFARKYLPLAAITGVNFGRLAGYPFFLMGQIFSASIYVSGIILRGAKTDILRVSTLIKNEQLRIMLADSVTLTPGSMLLELDGEKMTILWLRPKSAPAIENTPDAKGQIMDKLENRLMAAQTREKGE